MVRVVTWNVWGRNGPWEDRQPAIAAVLAAEAPDVVCLQESWREVNGPSQAALLADALALHHVDADHHGRGNHDVTIGNAVLTRWPVLMTETLWLPRVAGGLPYRTLLRVDIAAPPGVIQVYCTHLDWQYDASAARAVQTRALAHFVAERRGDPGTAHPPVVAGDFNAVPDADEIRLLTGRSAAPVSGLVFQDAWEVAGDGNGNGVTWSRHNPYCVDAAWPERRIDYVLVGWPRPRPTGNPLSCRVIGVDAVNGVHPSDHYGLVAELA